ncbi:hypothetical protein QOT17_013970 [Balamuthia mandrillaris]
MAEACYVFRAMTTITSTTTTATTSTTTTQTRTCSVPTSSGHTKRNSNPKGASLPRKGHETTAKRRGMEAASPPEEEEARGQENRDLENAYALMASLGSPGYEDGDMHTLASAFSTTLPRLPICDAHGAFSWMPASSSAEAQVPLHYALQTTTSPRDVIPPLLASLSPRSSGMQVAAVATQTEGQLYKRKRPSQQEMAALRREHHVQLQALRDENSRLRCLLHQELVALDERHRQHIDNLTERHRQHIDNLTESHQRQLDTHKEQATQLRIQVALLQQEKEMRA